MQRHELSTSIPFLPPCPTLRQWRSDRRAFKIKSKYNQYKCHRRRRCRQTPPTQPTPVLVSSHENSGVYVAAAAVKVRTERRSLLLLLPVGVAVALAQARWLCMSKGHMSCCGMGVEWQSLRIIFNWIRSINHSRHTHTHTHSGTHPHTHLQQRHCTPANFFNLLGPSRAIYSSLHTRIRTQVRPIPSQLKSCSWCCSDPIWSNLSLGSSSVLFFNKLIYGPWLITERQLGSAQFAWAPSLLMLSTHKSDL